MNTVRDLRCPDGHYEISVFYKLADAPPQCLCGKERLPFYATREMEGRTTLEHAAEQVGTFRPVKYDGVVYQDKASLDAVLHAYADRQGVPRDSYAFETLGNKAQRVEERRHRAWEKRKREGFDTQKFKDYQREQTARSTR